MPIQVLPPQLANQIAAGEVVERPASVVKELVENSLDAGANHIQIEIENGGASLIRIRDNGSGIPKEELSLALARHATSKISSLEDLDGILSLGFRGEALASISSVSRLTLTSRPAQQSEAWQVYAQGREMETIIQPASHPVGTTVEVANLFFNTPARRKFLRTDKTEFAHIDEVIRRIALAKPHIAFSLSHNGKIIRQYKSAVDPKQRLKRLANICGEHFVQNALYLDWQHEDLHLYGWVATPAFIRPQNDLNYCYINGRMVRDKVINHAIRQAYADYLNNEQYPAFVLFIDLNPNDVDVNVHPTKHEVRFHQQRLIHDFIYQGITQALNSELKFTPPKPKEESINQVAEPQGQWQHSPLSSTPNRLAAGGNIFSSYAKESSEGTIFSQSSPHFAVFHSEKKPSKPANQTYGELLRTNPPQTKQLKTETGNPSRLLRTLALVQNQALLLQQEQQFYLLSLAQLQQLHIRLSLQQNATQQSLLIPVVFRLNPEQQQHWQQQKSFFQQYGFEFTEHLSQARITLNKIPSILWQQNLQPCIIGVLNQSLTENELFLTALCQQFQFKPIEVVADAVNLLTQTEQLSQPTQQLQQLLVEIDWQPYLNKL